MLDARAIWILESVAVYGFVSRRHVIRQFGVSTRAAAALLASVAAAYPDRLRYNPSAKHYEGSTRPLPEPD
jgi:hypothetical protein